MREVKEVCQIYIPGGVNFGLASEWEVMRIAHKEKLTI